MQTSQKNSGEEISLFNAIKENDRVKVNQIVKDKPELLLAYDYRSFGATPLNLLSHGKDLGMVDLLLELGADPNRKSDWPMGPWNPVQIALSGGNDDFARYLIDRGAHLGVHEAAGLGLLSELKTLLQKNPELVSSKGGDGCTPLHFAGSKEAVDLLLEFGADMEARDVDHYSTPTQYLAQHRPEVTRHLFDRGAHADIFSVVLVGDLSRFEKLIAKNPSLLQLKINQTTFPPGPEHDVHNILTFVVGMDTNLLHTAAMGSQLEMIERLVSLGLDIDSRGGYDQSTALHMAAWCNNLSSAQKLVELGASIDLRSGEIHNNTPAGWAIVGGSADVFCYLIEQGAKVQGYFSKDINAGLSGEFQKYQRVDLDNFECMKKAMDNG